MRVGFATADITPNVGMERPGSIAPVFCAGVHDPCLVSACVLGNGERAIAIVGIDTISVKRSVVDKARAIIATATGIAPSHVMVGASHTHAGGPIAEHTWSTNVDPTYVAHVTHQIAATVIDAHRRASDLDVGVGTGEARGVAFPRRWKMRDGSIWSHPGTRKPKDMVEPESDPDVSVGVIGACDASGNLRGCIVNFGCHGTTGLGVDGKASADWVYFLRDTLRSVFGPDFGVVFVNGTCADVTQVDNRDPGPHWSGRIVARRVGMTIAGEVMKVLAQLRYHEQLAVDGVHSVVQLRPRRVTDEMCAWAEAHRDSPSTVDGRWFEDKIWAREWRELAALVDAEPAIPAEVQALRVGDAAIASVPAELFTVLGRDIKRRSTFPTTMVATLANGMVGYVAPASAYADDYIPRPGRAITGGYETYPARSSRCAPGSGELLVDTSVQLLEQLGS